MNALANLIDGEWVGGAPSPNVNPSNVADVVGEYAQAGEAEVRAAIAAARAAFPAWSRGGIQARADALDQIGTEILARKDELGHLLSREEGKTLPEGMGEVARAGKIFKFFAGEALRTRGRGAALGAPGHRRSRSRASRWAWSGIITPWNFPIAIPAWKIAPALAYGNCVVIKPADLVPGCAWALAEIIARSGMPAGVFNLVMGRGAVVGEILTSRPRSTPSASPARRRPASASRGAARERLAKVQLEMGGKNPQVVLDDADLDGRGELRGPERVLLDRPALHGRQPADRHRRHPRPLRRGAGRADGAAEGRRRARRRAPTSGPVVDQRAARPGPRLHRDRQGRRRAARRRRRAAEARRPRASTSRRRCSPRPTPRCASIARRSSGRWRA